MTQYSVSSFYKQTYRLKALDLPGTTEGKRLEPWHSPVLLHSKGSASSGANRTRTPTPIWDSGILSDEDRAWSARGDGGLLSSSPSHGIFKKSTPRNLSSEGVAAPFRKGTSSGKPQPLPREPRPRRAAEATSINQRSSPSRCRSCKDAVRKQQGSKTRDFSRSSCWLKAANSLPEEMDALQYLV